jgi:AraC-type DNA-binding domain-containing proteins
MDYREYKPSKELADYIECYWLAQFPAGAAPKHELIVPGGRVEVMINMGAAAILWNSAGKTFELKSSIYVLGQRNTFFNAVFQPGAVWGIRFRPACFHLFCDVPASCLLNELMEAAQVLKGIDTAKWYGEVINSDSDSRKIAATEFFLKKANYSIAPHYAFNKMLSGFTNNYGENSVIEFCNRNRVYYKKLERQFLQFAGYTPKEFFNIRRFYNALTLIYKTNKRLTDICHYLGYYDQSHFIKDFKSYTSLPPSKFLKGNYEVPRLITASASV